MVRQIVYGPYGWDRFGHVTNQDWTLDGVGNWTTFNDDGISQARTHNAANEITQIHGDTTNTLHDALQFVQEPRGLRRTRRDRLAGKLHAQRAGERRRANVRQSP